MATVVVGLVNFKDIREGVVNIPSQVLQLQHFPRGVCELWLHDCVQGEILNTIMCGQVRFKIANMLRLTRGQLVHWYIHQLGYALE